MAFNPKPVIQKMHTFLASGGRCSGGVTIGEPKAPTDGLAAAVIIGPIAWTETSLVKVSGRVDLIVRFYKNALADPADETEFLLAQTALEVMEDIAGDFDFGDANVRNLIPLSVAMVPGYLDIGPTKFRVMDITVPLMVNDLATFG